MPSHRQLLKTGLRLVCAAALVGLGACQTLGSSAEQKAFVAAHVVKPGEPVTEGVIYLAQDAAYARVESGQTVLARAEP